MTYTNETHSFLELIKSRRSVRGFLDRPVEPELVRALLEAARTAPSGSNMQPWHVHVVSGKARERLAAALCQAHANAEPEQREYAYYPEQWRSPYLERRRENGWGLYGALGITKGDKQAMHDQRGRNYAFFGAPVVLMFTIDSDLNQGSWLDYGMFIQNIMIGARALGLHTCPQAALGYEDPDDPANRFRASRLPIDAFTTFHS